MSEVNLDRLRELAGYLLGAVRELRELGRTPREVFLADSTPPRAGAGGALGTTLTA